MPENEVITQPEQEVTTPETAPVDAFEDDWSDIDLNDTADDSEEPVHAPEEKPEDPEPEADQQKEEDQAGEGQNGQTDEEKPEEDEEGEVADQQTFDLRYLGETKTVNREEVITLAQKGLNYDKVVQERNNMRAEHSKLKGYESFLEELAREDGLTIDALMDETRAEILAQREGIDKSVALQRVKLDRDKKEFQAEKQKATADQQAEAVARQRQEDNFLRFIREYPDVDPKTIPAEVWKAYGDGADLVGSYTAYENKRLKEKLRETESALETERQNAKNKERSIGSQKSSGADSHKRTDPIDDDWYSGD